MANPVVVKIRRRMISVQGWTPQQPTPPNRGGIKIDGWTEGMARRMRLFIDNFRDDFEGMVTLTYPDTFPQDGREVKRHWRAFIERIRRTGWLDDGSLVWFLEFQARGAPHIHCLITKFLRKDLVALFWSDITGGNIAACSRVEALRSPDSAGSYARKYAVKSEQKTVPAEFVNVGRMWGCVGAKRNSWNMPFIPCMVASTKAPMSGVQRIVLLAKTNARVVEHETGFVVYGTAREIREIWHCLQGAELFVGLNGSIHGSSQRRRQEE